MDEWLKGLLKEVQLLADTNAVKTAFQTKDWTSLMEEYLPPRLKERPDYEMFFYCLLRWNQSQYPWVCFKFSRQTIFHRYHEK